MKTFTIGQLSEKAGMPRDTIRYYETLNLLQPADRTKAGYRLYTSESLKTVTFIRRAKDLNFTLEEIQGLLSLEPADEKTARDFLMAVKSKTSKTQQDLQYLHDLQAALETLSGSRFSSDFSILDYFHADKCASA